MKQDFHRLAHSVWDCKYHIVWIPKYRRKELYGTKRKIVVETIKQWARIKGIDILEGHELVCASTNFCLAECSRGNTQLTTFLSYINPALLSYVNQRSNDFSGRFGSQVSGYTIELRLQFCAGS